MELKEQTCVACQGGVPPMKGKELEEFMKKLGKGWNLENDHHIWKEFSFKDWKEAQEFVVKVGNLAEQQQHHPSIQLDWGKVKITLWTHKIEGLFVSDFILAAKIDAI